MRGRFRGASLTARTLVMSAVLAVVLVGTLVALIVSVEGLRSVTRERREATQAVRATDRAEELLLEIEVREHALVLRGEPGDLEALRAAQREFRSALGELTNGSDPHAEYRAGVREAQTRGLRYLQQWDREVSGLALKDLGAARDLVAGGRGQREAEGVQAQLAALADHAIGDAKERASEADEGADRAVTTAAVGLGASLLLLLGYAGYVSRWVVRPIRRVVDAADRLAAGDLAARAAVAAHAEPARLAQSFNAMAAALDRAQAETEAATLAARGASEAKTRFVSRMSHELQTPVNVITAFAHLLDSAELDDHEKKWLAHIHKASQHLLGLLRETLDISTVESGAIPVLREPVSLVDAVLDVVDLCEPLAEQRGISLRYLPGDVDCVVLADPKRLRQVLFNLVTNAIKYHDREGEVTLESRRLDDGRLRVSVRDTGVGIPADRLDTIFEPFERLTNARDIEGTGLGLALARRLTEAMGGELSAQSSLGAGSTFMVDLESTQLPGDVGPPPPGPCRTRAHQRGGS